MIKLTLTVAALALLLGLPSAQAADNNATETGKMHMELGKNASEAAKTKEKKKTMKQIIEEDAKVRAERERGDHKTGDKK